MSKEPVLCFVGITDGALLRYRCETCGLEFHLKPYERICHTPEDCLDEQRSELATVRPPPTSA